MRSATACLQVVLVLALFCPASHAAPMQLAQETCFTLPWGEVFAKPNFEGGEITRGPGAWAVLPDQSGVVIASGYKVAQVTMDGRVEKTFTVEKRAALYDDLAIFDGYAYWIAETPMGVGGYRLNLETGALERFSVVKDENLDHMNLRAGDPRIGGWLKVNGLVKLFVDGDQLYVVNSHSGYRVCIAQRGAVKSVQDQRGEQGTLTFGSTTPSTDGASITTAEEMAINNYGFIMNVARDGVVVGTVPVSSLTREMQVAVCPVRYRLVGTTLYELRYDGNGLVLSRWR